ncbi:hypothetical protein GH733_000665 [Mirounga leonina]|nr:hypothetical protein GH733_000665 [Mirounga leonina]
MYTYDEYAKGYLDQASGSAILDLTENDQHLYMNIAHEQFRHSVLTSDTYLNFRWGTDLTPMSSSMG